jgi:hypothetical protein
LLLLLEVRLLLAPELRLLLALARSLCARLFWVLALPPLPAACALPDLPEDEDDLEDEEEEEFRDAMACSLDCEADTWRARPLAQGFRKRPPCPWRPLKCRNVRSTRMAVVGAALCAA